VVSTVAAVTLAAAAFAAATLAVAALVAATPFTHRVRSERRLAFPPHARAILGFAMAVGVAR